MNTPEVFQNGSLTVAMQDQVQEFRKLCLSLGLYGEIFLEEFDKTNTNFLFSCADLYEIGMSGAYESYDQEYNFVNRITIYSNHIDVQELFNTLFHEGIHAVHANTSAAALANQHLDIAPYDALKMMFAEELDTTAKENMFHFLCRNLITQEEDLQSHDDKDFLVNWIQSQRMTSLFDNLYQNRAHGKEQREIYIDRILSHYEDNMDYYKECDELIEYTEIDLWETGNSLGFNAFGRTAVDINFQARTPMDDDQWFRLRKIEQEMQTDKKQIISFSDYLRNRKMSREEFLIEARTNNITRQSYFE